MGLFSKKFPLERNVYHLQGKGELEGKRFHLRVDNEKRGILIMDASKMLILNGTGILYAYYILNDFSQEEIVKKVKRQYKVGKKQVMEDLKEFRKEMHSLLSGEDVVTAAMSDMSDIYKDQNAPYRMDLALTYNCNNDCGHCYNEKRESKELDTEEWMEILSNLWEVGIPHIVFTGGEPTMRDDLSQLISYAEELGQITGLNTNGRKLKDKNYLKELISSGLDHIQITLGSHKKRTHEAITGSGGSYDETLKGIRNGLKTDTLLVLSTNYMHPIKEEVLDTIRFLRDLGVKHIAVNSLIRSGKGKEAEGVTISRLKDILSEGRRLSILNDFEFRWYTPTPYCVLNPMELELGIKQCTACKLNMAVEPNGDVIPCQSFYEVLGNILKEDFYNIWNADLCKDIRNGELVPEKCLKCDLYNVCGGGCPLSWKSGDYLCMDVLSS